MASPYRKSFTSMWSDRTFTALSEPAQRLHELMRTQPNLSFCGVIMFTPRRWARLSSSSTVKGLERALAELEEAGLVVFEPETEEVFLRAFIRDDDVLKSPNIAKSMVRDYCGVLSERVRRAIAEEIPDPIPDPVWKRYPEGFPEPFAKEVSAPRGKGSPDPSPDPSGKTRVSNPCRATTQQQQQQHQPIPGNGTGVPAGRPPPPPPPAPPAASTLDAVVELTLRRRGKHETALNHRDPDGWLAGARSGIRTELKPAWERIVAEHPDWDDEHVADALRPNEPPTPRRLTSVPPPLEPDPDCPWCEGRGMSHEDGRDVACDCRHTTGGAA